MSHDHAFDPQCPGCRPCIVDPQTRQPLPDDHFAMVVANEIWDALPFEDQWALNRIWVHNSREPEHLEVAQRFTATFQSRTAN